MRVRVRVRVSECDRKICNANRVPKSDDRTESNLRRGRREGGKVGGRQGGGEGREGGEGEGGEIERNLAIARVTPATFASFRD